MASYLLLEAGIAFAVLALAALLAIRAKQSVIPAYILVGIVVGPSAPSVGGLSLSLVRYREFVEVFAELGIVFLLFFLGLEFSVDQLLARRDRILGSGVVDLVVNFGLGLALGALFGLSALESLFVAGIVYISSSAVITKSLIDLGWIADPESEPILGTLVFEDIVIAVYLAVLSALVLSGGTAADVAVSVGIAFAFLAALVLVAFYGTAQVERRFDVRSDELFLLAVLGTTALVAGLALAVGVSEAVAAFFVGTAFSATSHVRRIERIVSPARDLFAAMFFLSIGLTTDLTAIVAVLDLLAVAVVVSVVGKFASGIAGGRLYGLDRRRSIRVGVGLIARGEFSLVIATLAVSAGTTPVLREVIPAFAVGYVLVMSVVGTVAMRYADVVTARSA